jgi:phosphoribulokinase
MTPEELQKIAQSAMQGLDLSNFKGEVTAFKYVENEIGNVEKDGIGIQHNYYQNGAQPEQTEPDPLQALPAEQPTGELTDGTIDQHRRLFKEAMLKAQDYKPKDSYRYLLSNTYDWVAAERWGKDLGIIKNYAQLEGILQDKRFREVPKNSQNLTKYRAYIDDNTRYPNWQCSVPDVEGFFRKFKEIADLINSIYKLGCQREHIKPYGSQ